MSLGEQHAKLAELVDRSMKDEIFEIQTFQVRILNEISINGLLGAE